MGQQAPFSVKRFFEEDSVIHLQLKANFRELQRERMSDEFRPAIISVLDGAGQHVLEAPAEIRARGDMRREKCFPPPVMINFKLSDSSSLRKLGRLKMVAACTDDPYSDQLALKEYLVYRMYQLFTPYSFRVRLLKMDYVDSTKKNFSRTRFAFFIEDVDDMAKRNGYRETEERYTTPGTDRYGNTLFSMFQYMIGNTDWAIPLTRNLKLIYPKENPAAPPVPVPYDFDYSGLVNAGYAVPSEELPIANVRDRYYQGFERTEGEILDLLQLFRKNKKPMMDLIATCPYLRDENKRDMINYLEGFYIMIENRRDVIETFITNARKK